MQCMLLVCAKRYLQIFICLKPQAPISGLVIRARTYVHVALLHATFATFSFPFCHTCFWLVLVSGGNGPRHQPLNYTMTPSAFCWTCFLTSSLGLSPCLESVSLVRDFDFVICGTAVYQVCFMLGPLDGQGWLVKAGFFCMAI